MSDVSRTGAVVDALGTAWTVFSLYPDPENQPAFRRAVELLQEVSGGGIHLDLDSSGFSADGEPVSTDREGADRFAKRCYLHRVESFSIANPPEPRDVERLFTSLAKDESASAASGGIEAELRRDGVVAFSVGQRSMLRTVGEEDAPERARDVQDVLDASVDPEGFAQALIDEAGGEDAAIIDLFCQRYRDTVAHVDESDVYGLEGLVQAFVEAFFYLNEQCQVGAFRAFLDSDDSFDRAFLDQFAGHELAKIAPRLDSQGLALLLDYARVATDQADGRPDELLGILKNPEALHSVREVAAAKVQERLSELTEAVESSAKFLELVRDHFPDPRRYFYDSLEVFRGLLAVETRDDRFKRLIRVWVGKVSASVRSGDFRRGELWLRSVTSKPTYAAERMPDIEQALGQIATTEIMELIVAEAASAEGEAERGSTRESSLRLLDALGRNGMTALIDLLAQEEDRSRRRLLVGLLSEIAKDDPAPIVARLSDDRWYVVRNLLTVLRDASTAEATAAISHAMDHPDGRVRIEALRAMGASDAGAMGRLRKAIADPEEKVRQAAIGMLGSNRTDDAEAILVELLGDRSAASADKQRAVTALGGRTSRSSYEHLKKLAEKRFVFGAQARNLRDSARTAVNRRKET